MSSQCFDHTVEYYSAEQINKAEKNFSQINKIAEICQAQWDTFYMIPLIATGECKAIQKEKGA